MTDPGTVVVTGGSGGIGTGIVSRLAADGFRVATFSRTAPPHPDAVAGSFGVDVSDPDSVGRGFAALDGERIVGAVTSAAINVRARAVDFTASDFAEMFAVNVTGTFLVAREAAVRMSGGGSIVTISSTMAFVGSRRNQAAYSATKGAVSALTRALAVEWAEQGVRVNAVAPTFTETPMNAPILAQPELAESIRAAIPLGRFGTPDDVAGAVSWLLGPDSSFVTGHTLPVDGGYLSL